MTVNAAATEYLGNLAPAYRATFKSPLPDLECYSAEQIRNAFIAGAVWRDTSTPIRTRPRMFDTCATHGVADCPACKRSPVADLCSCASTTDPACPAHGTGALASDRTAPLSGPTHARVHESGLYEAAPDGNMGAWKVTMRGTHVATVAPYGARDTRELAQQIADALNAADYVRTVMDRNGDDPNLGAAVVGHWERPQHELAGSVILHLLNVLDGNAPNEREGEAGTAGVVAALGDSTIRDGVLFLGGIAEPTVSIALHSKLREDGWFRRPAEPVARAEAAFAKAVCGYRTRREFAPKVLDELRKAGLYIATAEELDPPVCRLQLPDGSVPGNAAEAAEAWYKVAVDARADLAVMREHQGRQTDSVPMTTDDTFYSERTCRIAHRVVMVIRPANAGDAIYWQWRRDISDIIEAELSAPIPMILHCPACYMPHVDKPDPERGWTNPPHKSHLCRVQDGGCGCVWRPADVPTAGVARIETRGAMDTWPPRPRPDGPSSPTGLPDGDEQAAMMEAGAGCYGTGCDEFPGLTAHDRADRIRRVYDPRGAGRPRVIAAPGAAESIESVYLGDERVWPRNPTDAFAALARHMGWEVDEEKLEQVRRYCDEPVAPYRVRASCVFRGDDQHIACADDPDLARAIADALNAVDGMTCTHCHDLGNAHAPDCPEAPSPLAGLVQVIIAEVERRQARRPL